MITITATQSRSHVTRRIVSQNQNLEVNNKEGRRFQQLVIILNG